MIFTIKQGQLLLPLTDILVYVGMALLKFKVEVVIRQWLIDMIKFQPSAVANLK